MAGSNPEDFGECHYRRVAPYAELLDCSELFEQCYFACMRRNADSTHRTVRVTTSFRMGNGEWCSFDADAIDCKPVRSVGR
jgi:hypothetical protein